MFALLLQAILALCRTGTATARGRRGMMRNCAVATGLLGSDERVRGAGAPLGGKKVRFTPADRSLLAALLPG